MPIEYAYPPQLAQFLRHAWKAADDAPTLLDQVHLEHMLTVAYQASLLRDEDRTVRVRIVAARPEEFDPLQGPPEGIQPLVFDQPVRTRRRSCDGSLSWRSTIVRSSASVLSPATDDAASGACCSRGPAGSRWPRADADPRPRRPRRLSSCGCSAPDASL